MRKRIETDFALPISIILCAFPVGSSHLASIRRCRRSGKRFAHCAVTRGPRLDERLRKPKVSVLRPTFARCPTSAAAWLTHAWGGGSVHCGLPRGPDAQSCSLADGGSGSGVQSFVGRRRLFIASHGTPQPLLHPVTDTISYTRSSV